MCIERSLDGWKGQCLQCSYICECDMRPKLEKEVTFAGARRTVASEPIFDAPSHDSY